MVNPDEILRSRSFKSFHFPDCGARFFTTNLGGFPGTVFVMIGSLDQPSLFEPMLEIFTKRRLKWTKALDVPQFQSMPV